MIASSLYRLCALSLFCGLCLQLAPQNGAKRVLRLLSALVLLMALLQAFRGFSFADYAVEMTRIRESQARLESDSAEIGSRLNRLVIEQELRTYIEDKARETGAVLSEVKPSLRWSPEGFWVPEGLLLRGRWSEQQRSQLERVLETELGIPEEAQQWCEDE